MNKKMRNTIIALMLLSLVAAGIIWSTRDKADPAQDNYVYIVDDFLGSWSFDRNSIEERHDPEEDLQVIDVWLKRDISEEATVCARDELLWHIDPDGSRYKVSDAYAYDGEETLIET